MQVKAAVAGAVTDFMHGVEIDDPFRWLEDRNSVDTQAWIETQQKAHDEYFADLSGLDNLRSRVASCVDIEVIDQPVRAGDKLFYRRRAKGQEQACICMKTFQDEAEITLVDPSPLGDFSNVRIHRVSSDGSLLAYELRQGGSDISAIHIVETANRHVLPDHLRYGYQRGLVIAPDNFGFYYAKDSHVRENMHAILYHRMGDEGIDTELFRRPKFARSRLTLIADESRLGAFYVYDQDDDLKADLYIANYCSDKSWTPIFSGRTLPCSPILKLGRIYLFSQNNAPNGRISELGEDGSELQVLVPEINASIRQIAFTSSHIFTSYYIDGTSVVHRRPLIVSQADRYEVVNELSGSMTVDFLPSLGYDVSSFFYSRESFTEPPQVLEHPGQSSDFACLPTRSFTGPRHYRRVEVVHYRSDDGIDIPLTIVAEGDATSGLPRPVIMTSYGGFGVSMMPRFSVLVSVLIEFGAVFAVPSIRGGSEFGRDWHEAGRRRNRQKSFTDFIFAAEWLCANGVTKPTRIAAFGGSNSGLLVEAVAVQRPDLFGAVVCIAPLLDMLRYERFDQARKWTHEYGSIEDPDDFRALRAYSPYQNIRAEIDYPATLFITGDKDDRCNPAHVRKMAARLQDREAQSNPILVEYTSERGHSPTIPLSVRVHSLARRIAFICNELDIPTQPGGDDETTRL